MIISNVYCTVILIEFDKLIHVGDLDYWINKVTILFESKQAKINACSQFARKLYFIQTNVYVPSTPLPLQKKNKKITSTFAYQDN